MAMIRKSLSQSFLRTLALWSIGDGYSHPWDVNEKEEIQRLAKECIYAFIGRVSYWVRDKECGVQLDNNNNNNNDRWKHKNWST